MHELLELFEHGESGVLELADEDTTTLVYFDEGQPVWVEDGPAPPPLGRLLLRRGALTEAQYDKAIEEVSASALLGRRIGFEEVVLEAGDVTAAQIEAARAEQVRERVLQCFVPEHPRCLFFRSEPDLDAGRIELELEPLIHDALQRHYDDRLEALLAPFAERVGVVGENAGDLEEVLTLEDAQHTWLSQLDGETTVRKWVEAGPWRPRATLIATLIATGFVKPRRSGGRGAEPPSHPEEPSASASRRTASHPQRSGVDRATARDGATRRDGGERDSTQQRRRPHGESDAPGSEAGAGVHRAAESESERSHAGEHRTVVGLSDSGRRRRDRQAVEEAAPEATSNGREEPAGAARRGRAPVETGKRRARQPTEPSADRRVARGAHAVEAQRCGSQSRARPRVRSEDGSARETGAKKADATRRPAEARAAANRDDHGPGRESARPRRPARRRGRVQRPAGPKELRRLTPGRRESSPS